ncbi:MAG: acyl-CoA dehydrogenase family protein [Flavobacteriales bacterium]
MLDNILNKEDLQLYIHASDFSRKHLSGSFEEADRSCSFAKLSWDQLVKSGYTSLFVSKENGGYGLGLKSVAAVLNGLSRYSNDNGLLFSLAAHLLAAQAPIVKFLNPGHNIFKEICGGSILANAMSESQGGSDAFSMTSTAQRKNSGYQIRASKVFVTNAPIASFALVFAVTDIEKGVFGGISCFIVPKENFEAGAPLQKMGLRTSPTAELFVDSNCSNDNMLGSEGSGFITFQYAMNAERIGIAALHLGTMERLLSSTLEKARQKKPNGKDLMAFQAVSHLIAEMKVKIDASRLFVYHAAEMFDKGYNVNDLASEVKVLVSESLNFCASTALQIHAGNGYVEGWLERFVRDAHAATIYSGTTEIQKNIIAAHLI